MVVKFPWLAELFDKEGLPGESDKAASSDGEVVGVEPLSALRADGEREVAAELTDKDVEEVFELLQLKRQEWEQNAPSQGIRADFWAGDPTKHFSVKKKGVFSEKGEGFSESGVWQGFLQERQLSEEVRAIQ